MLAILLRRMLRKEGRKLSILYLRCEGEPSPYAQELFRKVLSILYLRCRRN